MAKIYLTLMAWIMRMIVWSFVVGTTFVSAERSLRKQEGGSLIINEALEVSDTNYLINVANLLWQSNQSGYQHVWPVSLFIFIIHNFCDFKKI